MFVLIFGTELHPEIRSYISRLLVLHLGYHEAGKLDSDRQISLKKQIGAESQVYSSC